MSTDDLTFLSATQLSSLLRTRQTSTVELVKAYLDRIERLDTRLRAYITVAADQALEDAALAEEELSQGQVRGPLHGIPIAVKDQLHARGLPTTAGSSMLKEVAQEDSTVVARLREAGTILLGKLNLSEFALGGNINHPYGTPRNPWDRECQAGPSSSGSGVAVSASLCTAAIGEDTGGSIRIPAAWCGVVGLRPTWGRVSRHGMLGVSWSMDQAGPMTKTVKDCSLVFQTIAGYDPRDPSTSRHRVPLFQPEDSLDGLRVAIVQEAMDSTLLQKEIRSAVNGAVDVMAQAGASVSDVSIPLFSQGGVISTAITDAEAAYVHRHHLKALAAEYDVASRRRLLAASLIPAQLYQKAIRLRVILRNQVLSALKETDVLITPTQPTPAAKIETTTGLNSKDDVVTKFYGPRGGTGAFNLAAVPALSMPCGFTTGGLPIGMQLAGRPFEETTVFQAAHAYENRTQWHSLHPPLEDPL